MVFYNHTKLPEQGKFIRILTLHPGSFNSPIECDLKATSLDSTATYGALSYVWGDDTYPGSILLHGFRHEVTLNLESALRHLRFEDKARDIWVDALCINQDDLDERTQQVRMMAEIYRRADATLSWLGEKADGSDEAMDLIEMLGTLTRENEDLIFDDDFEGLPDDGSLNSAVDRIEWLGFPMATQNWPALWRLLERPYWTRVWIIQELAARGRILKSDGTFYCGTKQIDRKDFDYCCSLLLFLVLYGGGAQIGAQTGNVSEPVHSMLVGGHPPGLTMVQTMGACSEAANRSMDWLIRVTGRFKATDPRDKLYALRGLAEDGNLCDPDYTKDLQTMLKDFVTAYVARYQSLRVLLGNKYRENPLGPSWVPDILDDQFHGGRGLIPATQSDHFQASGPLTSFVTFHSDGGPHVLSAKGILVGEITTLIGPMLVGEKGFDVSSPHEDLVTISKAIGQDKFFEDLRRFRRTLHHPQDFDIFWRTLCLDGDWVGLDPEFPAPKGFADQIEVAFGQKEKMPDDFMKGESEADRYVNFVRPFLHSLQAALTNRTFFTTKAAAEAVGRMGVGPYCAQPGDVVVLLFGAVFCVVLRPVDAVRSQQQPYYRLVGDAYVHGIMQGKLVQGVDVASAASFDII